MLKLAMWVLAYKHVSRWDVKKLIKTHKNNRGTSKTKIPAAFNGYRNGTFSLKACKLYTSARLKGSNLKKVHPLMLCTVVLLQFLIKDVKMKLHNIIILRRSAGENPDFYT